MIAGLSAALARGALTHPLLLPLAHKVRFRVLQHIVRPVAQHRFGEVAQDGLELLRYSDVHRRCPFSADDHWVVLSEVGHNDTKGSSAVYHPAGNDERDSTVTCPARELWRRARGRRRAPLVNKRHMLMCAAASSENCAVSQHQHSVLMGPVPHRTPANGYADTTRPTLTHPVW